MPKDTVAAQGQRHPQPGGARSSRPRRNGRHVHQAQHDRCGQQQHVISNASVTAQTAGSCNAQPTVWKKTAAAASNRCAHHRKPLPGHREQPPNGVRAVVVEVAAVAAGREHRQRQQSDAHEAEDDQAGDRPVRDPRREQHVEDEQRDGEEVEQTVCEPCREGWRSYPGRVGDAGATRRHGELPARAGSTALPSNPTPKAEKTWWKGGCGSSSAWPIVRCHEKARARTERRFSATPAMIHRQLTKSNAW